MSITPIIKYTKQVRSTTSESNEFGPSHRPRAFPLSGDVRPVDRPESQIRRPGPRGPFAPCSPTPILTDRLACAWAGPTPFPGPLLPQRPLSQPDAPSWKARTGLSDPEPEFEKVSPGSSTRFVQGIPGYVYQKPVINKHIYTYTKYIYTFKKIWGEIQENFPRQR